ncbi:MAG: hypothetical protein ACLVKO_09165 [Dysgonomonas sp.]
MKKVICVISLTLTVAAICAQQTIDGVGKLRLGSSPEVLKEIGFDLDNTIPITSTREYFDLVYSKKSGGNVYQLFPEKEKNEDYGAASLDGRVSVYFIPEYNPAGNVVMRRVYLRFLNDSLYYIKADQLKELTNAFDLKYGKSTYFSSKDMDDFKKYSDESIPETIHIFRDKWQTGDPKILCSVGEFTNHKLKGSNNKTSFFIITDLAKYANVSKAEYKIKASIKENEIQDKLKDLEGL